jgi:serine/threonine protein kinase
LSRNRAATLRRPCSRRCSEGPARRPNEDFGAGTVYASRRVEPGDVLARRYELEVRLGKGGMGEVWRARNLGTNERVAVKVLRDELSEDSALHARFLREARAAKAVKHPNVVELREVHEDDRGAPFLVMELLEGETLGRRLVRCGPLSAAETSGILLPVIDAVEAAHRVGLVHRDLKPENVFLAASPDGSVAPRVLDFGIAKEVAKLATPTTASSAETTAPPATTASMVGTPYYMAPEQALGERDIDARVDVWALGVIAYECLSGKRPTEATTLGGILKIIVTDGVPPLDGVAPSVDPTLAQAVMRMLRTDRDARAGSFDELRDSLERLRDSTSVLVLPDSEIQLPDVTVVRPRARVASTARWAKVGAVAVGVVLAGAWLVRAERREEPPQAPVVTSAAPPLPVGVPPPSAEAVAAPAPSPIDSKPTTPRTSPPIRIAPRVVASAPLEDPAPRASGAPGRGPSGLVTDNPFAPSGERDR